ncbi:hypothetical protein INT43_001553 [Umbelopsis isabellina]|uniref:Uncharacterized protein n=1 Tax=Mortierella isabellina TaxID=91625 RepID=A0A8H7PDU9_MORIS|nr:hypothetical protein INT43_001553 [Umbelopsis isabellina]
MASVNVTALYPNSPTPDLSPGDWDFDPGYNLLLEGDEANRIFSIVNLCINSAGIAGGVLVCLIIALIRLYDKSLVDRVSLRLTAAVSTVDAIKAAAYIIFTFVATPGAACGATAWLILFLTNLYTFLSVAIAFNLQWVSPLCSPPPCCVRPPLVGATFPAICMRIIQSPMSNHGFHSQLFLQGKRVHPHLEKAYFLVSVLLALATTVPPWAAGRLGLDPNYGVCWYVAYSSKRTILWEWMTFLSWNLLGTVYCFFVVVAVVFKLKKNTQTIKSYNNANTSSSGGGKGELTIAQKRARRTQRTMNKLVLRICLYALIPIVTQTGWYISECIMQFQHYLNVPLDWYLIVTTDLPGVLNFVAFCLDPALGNALNTIKEDMIEKYGEQGTRSDTNDHRFARWITAKFLRSSKTVDDTTSPFYRMSASENRTKHDPDTSYPDEYIPYPPSGKPDSKNDSQFSMIRMPESDDGHSYEMSQVIIGPIPKKRRRKHSEDEQAKEVFRGL